MITISTPRRHQECNEENNPEAHRQDRHKPADQMAESPTRTGVQQEATDSMDNILIIHAAECISGSATCIEDIYNDANRTSRGGGGGGRRVRFA